MGGGSREVEQGREVGLGDLRQVSELDIRRALGSGRGCSRRFFSRVRGGAEEA